MVDKYHLKFNHVGFRLVKAALEAEGLPWEKHDSFCETCALTKTKSHNHIRVSIPRRTVFLVNIWYVMQLAHWRNLKVERNIGYSCGTSRVDIR
jgi:hypothetical protein